MKESKSRDRFNELAAEFQNNETTRGMFAQLATLRDAIGGLQKDGLQITLEVRPGAYKCPVEFKPEAAPLANGTINVEGVDIDFTFSRPGGSLRFDAYLGVSNICCKYILYAGDLQQAATDTILRVEAQRSLLQQFNMDESGNAGVATRKSVVISPPLKLKKPEQP